MKNKKKNLMLMVPMLHQGGFERVCIKTARLMQEYYKKGLQVVRLVIGDPANSSAFQEEQPLLDKENLRYHITPGVVTNS